MKNTFFFLFTLFAIGFCSFISNQLYAAPADPNPIEITQEDGSTFTYFLKGDEYVHWMQSADGYTLLYNTNNEIVYAKKNEDGELVPSEFLFNGSQLRSSALSSFLESTPKDLRFSKEQIQEKKAIWPTEDRDVDNQLRSGTATKKIKVPCILVGYPDDPFEKTADEFNALMNQTGYNVGNAKGSVRDFYLENSYDNLDIEFDIFGPYTTSQTKTNYTKESNYASFIEEAVRLADEDIDFSKYATNGIVERIYVVFAGNGDNYYSTGEQIWPHQSSINSRNVVLDDVKITRYCCTAELNAKSATELSSIGTMCHEFLHTFGILDYYDVDYSTSGEYLGTGKWDLMCSGNSNGNGHQPAHINMIEKIRLGWVTPIELTSNTNVFNLKNAAQNAEAYIIRPYNNGEVYVLENRQKVAFDTALPGNGLIIYHAQESAVEGSVNNRTHPQQAYIVSSISEYDIPNSNPDSYGPINSATTPFTNESGRNEFSQNSTPQLFRWTGTQGVPVDKSISNITDTDGVISFSYQTGGEANPTNPVMNLTAKVSCPNVELTWEAPVQEETTVCKSFAGEYKGSSYSLKMDGDVAVSVKFHPEDFQQIGEEIVLSKINFVPMNEAIEHSICVWNINNENTYSSPIYQQKITQTLNYKSNNEVYLDSPFPVANTEDLLIGILFKIKSGVSFLAADGVTAEDTSRFWFNVDGNWTTLSQVGIKSGFCFTACFDNAGLEPITPLPTSYNIYKNNLLIDNIDSAELSYVDSEVSNNSHCDYCVEAVYESTATSIPICKSVEVNCGVDIKEIEETGKVDVQIYPNPVLDILNITASTKIVSYAISDINGRELIFKIIHSNQRNNDTVNTLSWAPGIYFLKLETENGIVTKKIIKH